MLPGQADYPSRNTLTSLPQRRVGDAPKGVVQCVEVFTKRDVSFSSVQGRTDGSSSDAEVSHGAEALGYHARAGDFTSHKDVNEYVSLENFLAPLLAFMAVLFGFPVYPVSEKSRAPGSRSESVSTSFTDVDCDSESQQKACFSVEKDQDDLYQNNTPQQAKFDQNAAAAERGCKLSSLCCLIRMSSVKRWRWWRRVAFCAVISMQVFNVARTMAAFTDTTAPAFRWITSISYQITWVQQLLLFLLTHHSLSRHFPLLLSIIRRHEAGHGLHAKLGKFKVVFRRAVIFIGLFNVGVLFVFFWMILWLPDSHSFIKPFESIGGVAFIFLAMLMSATIAMTVNLNLSLLFFLAALSYVIRTEMLRVTQDFRLLLSPSSSESENVEQLDASLTDGSGASSTRRCQDFEGRLRILNSTGVSAANAEKPDRTTPSSCAFKNSPICNEQPPKRHEASVAQVPTSDNQLTLSPVSGVEMEKSFDQLHRRYESCHALLTLSGNCLRHVAPLCYVSGVLMLCCLIYGLASGALGQPGERTVQVMVAVDYVSLIAAVTVLGVLVNEAATSPCAAILAADWPTLPDSLINKLQLFAMRLTTGTMGYNVYGFFVITRDTVLMLAGTFITYSVIVVQFQMGSPPTSCCDVNATCTT